MILHTKCIYQVTEHIKLCLQNRIAMKRLLSQSKKQIMGIKFNTQFYITFIRYVLSF